jgi:hypothetical protein
MNQDYIVSRLMKINVTKKINIILILINELIAFEQVFYFIEKNKQAFLASFTRVSQYFFN